MSIQQDQNNDIEALTGAATLILIKTMGFPIMRHVRVVKAATRANQDDRQTLMLVSIEHHGLQPALDRLTRSLITPSEA